MNEAGSNLLQFELWEYPGGHTFFEVPSDQAAYQDLIRKLKLDEPDADHGWSVEARTWNEAMQALYDRKGWGRYRTIEEEFGESNDHD